MPKRKSEDSVDKLLKKIKKLEKKVRRQCRSRSRSKSRSLSPDDRYCSEDREHDSARAGSDVAELLDGMVDTVRDEELAGPSSMGTVLADTARTDDVTDVPATTSVTDSSTVAGPSTSVELGKEPTTEAESTDSAENRILLEILGDDPTICNTYGPEVHKDLAIRLEHIATNGLTKETRKEICDKYLLPSNCKLINAPTLNAEIKAAIGEIILKRDKNIEQRQKQTAVTIACLSQAIHKLLSSNSADPDLIKMLMDAERILCDSQHNDSVVRRNFILSTLKKDMNEQLRNTRPDSLLFGQNLTETIKTAKAINKSGADLKTPAARKQPLPSTSKKPAAPTGTTNNLNWKGPYPTRKAPNPPRTTNRPQNRKPPSSSSKTSQHQPPRNRR